MHDLIGIVGQLADADFQGRIDCIADGIDILLQQAGLPGAEAVNGAILALFGNKAESARMSTPYIL